MSDSPRREIPLPTIQLHYDGWLTLPADARQHLHLVTGDRVDIELTEAGLLLRPAKQDKEAVALEPMAAAALPAAGPSEPPAPVEAAPAIVMRGPSRPRKTVTPELALSVKVGGRRKSKPTDTP